MTVPVKFPTVLPADVEAVAQFFYNELMDPTPVATRLPRPADTDDTVHGFLRVEAGDISPLLEFRSVAWDLSFLIHAFSPNEIEAADIIGKAMALAASAHFQTIITERGKYYIVDVVNVIGGHRLPEPRVPDLTRYRAAVTWRVTGTITE